MKFIRTPFANNGDKDPVPQTDPSGNVNWDQGYPISYSKDPAVDPTAKRIEREMYNEVLNFITSGLREVQTTGVAPFIPAADNGGVAYPYGLGAIVNYLDVPYISLKANNTSLPTVVADWSPLASNAFVQDMIGNYSDTTLLTSSQTLTPQQAGMIFGLGTTGISITVPDLGLIPNGATYTFKNLVNGNVTILPPAGGTFYVSDQTVSSITLARGESVQLVGAATVYGAILTRNPGSMQSSIIVTANLTLTNGDIGKVINLSSGSPVLTLPLGSTVPNGATLEIFSSTPTASVVCSGPDLISIGVTAVSTINLLGGNSLRLIWTSGRWLAAGYMFGATPPQFDNDTSVATTEFVQRALGSKSGHASITSSRAITAADIGKSIFVNGASITITLPTPTSLGVPVGGSVLLFTTGSGCSVVPGSGATINHIDAVAASVSILAGQSITFIATSSTVWQSVSSTCGLGRNADFGASTSISGYQKLPSGLIIQWGQASSSSSAPTPVTFPIAFPTSARAVVATYGAGSAPNVVVCSSVSSTGFNVDMYLSNTGVRTSTVSGILWISIGH